MPNEEFDIMKPISADLDIGTTMFDKPRDSASSKTVNDIFSRGVSTDLDIGNTIFDSPLSEPTESTLLQQDPVPFAPIVAAPDIVKVERHQTAASQELPVIAPPDAKERSSSAAQGRVDLDYGFVTAEEAAMFADNADDIQNSQPVTSEMPTPATDASAVKPPDEVADSSNALERALEELQEVQNEMSSPLQVHTTSSEQLMQMALEAEYIEEQKLAEEEWFPNSTVRVMGKVVRGKSKNIATLVMLIIFLAVFLLVPIIVFLTNTAV